MDLGLDLEICGVCGRAVMLLLLLLLYYTHRHAEADDTIPSLSSTRGVEGGRRSRPVELSVAASVADNQGSKLQPANPG